ncbi:MAG: peptidylprolyl isomerase [endosymbiont of Galathealinum brachiosum]|uniref:Peptidyl-prolyl cis-trans isomerase n=1 Tax=endosymbiont of Galathealinum brachiosum TaxID=2200906 RepID=A0A370DDX5_9GAMM|nr:MAG: peptidylprolyl isomerase [endosymbiont of Galathealinum brachiosum]
MKTVENNSTILLLFKMELEDGTEIESNFNDDAIEFEIGNGSLTPGMEDALIGKAAGETVSVELSPELAFGMPDENNIHSIPVTDFPDDMPPEENQVIAFDGPDDSEIMGTIISISDEEVQVDFSHPLAGRIIKFTANINAIL